MVQVGTPRTDKLSRGSGSFPATEDPQETHPRPAPLCPCDLTVPHCRLIGCSMRGPSLIGWSAAGRCPPAGWNRR